MNGCAIGASDIRIETSIQRAVLVEPRDAVARQPAYRRELAPNNDLSIWLHRCAVNDAVHSGIETGIHVPRGRIGGRSQGGDEEQQERP